MKGQATNGSDPTDPGIGWYRLPVGWRKQLAANDNRLPPLRRIKRLIGNLLIAATIGAVIWGMIAR